MKRICGNCKFYEIVPEYIDDKFGKCNFLYNGKYPYWLLDELQGNIRLKLVPNGAEHCKSWKRKNVQYEEKS
jgi:hypothetical protein